MNLRLRTKTKLTYIDPDRANEFNAKWRGVQVRRLCALVGAAGIVGGVYLLALCGVGVVGAVLVVLLVGGGILSSAPSLCSSFEDEFNRKAMESELAYPARTLAPYYIPEGATPRQKWEAARALMRAKLATRDRLAEIGLAKYLQMSDEMSVRMLREKNELLTIRHNATEEACRILAGEAGSRRDRAPVAER